MELDPMTRARARLAIREAVSQYLYDRPRQIKLIDIGIPKQGGTFIEDKLAIRFHVEEKMDSFELESVERDALPPTVAGFETDVIVGSYRLHLWWGGSAGVTTAREQFDPLQGGISISDEFHTSAGTLGGFVQDRATGAAMILSNWHVLVAEWTARPGQRIYQPGRLDGGTRAEAIATLTRDAMKLNLDAAVASLTNARQFVNDQFDLRPISGVSHAEIGMQVVKSGRTSGITRGLVSGLGGTARINYGGVTRMIRNVVTIDPRFPFDEVSAPGDSGSIWLDADTYAAIGLHFAGSNNPERGLSLDMQAVLDALDVDLVTTSSVSAERVLRMPHRFERLPQHLIEEVMGR